MATSPEQQIQSRAAAQHRLISRRQAYEAGLSPRQVRYRVRTGAWQEVRPDVFQVDGRDAEGWHAVVMGAVLAVPGAVASHRTALWLADVARLGRPEEIDISAPNGRTAVLEGVVVHQHRRLDACDTRILAGIPTTTCERTIIDLAAGLCLSDRLDLVDAAICDGKARRKVLHRRAGELRRGRAGLAAVIAATAPDAAKNFRSWLEAEADRRWAARGLPPPRWNVPLRDERGRIGIVDAVFADGLVVVELDGLRFHRTPAQRRADNERDRRLALSGRIALRYTYLDIMERPDEVVAEISAAIRQVEQRSTLVEVYG